MFIIRSKSEPFTYYKGGSWTDNESDAKQYPSKQEAETIIRKHRMNADAIEYNPTADLDEPAETEK